MPMGEAKHRGPGAEIRPLREFQDKVLRPALVGIPGVAEVATLGGEGEEVLVQTTDAELRAAGRRVFGRRRPRCARRLDACAARRLRRRMLEHDPVLGKLTRVSVAARDVERRRRRRRRRGRSSVGIVVAKRGADPTAVIARVKQVDRARAPRACPRRRGWACSTIVRSWRDGSRRTLLRAVAEEVAVVALVVLMFLLHGRSALVPMLTLPLVVLLTFAAMRLLGIPATVMSLGGIAIALGMAVDAELVALEACHRRLETDAAAGPRARVGAGAGWWRRRAPSRRRSSRRC